MNANNRKQEFKDKLFLNLDTEKAWLIGIKKKN